MTPRAYYNEHEPFAAHVLRELIKENVIAPGEVDTRSIVDVRPDDLRGFTQCHFFAGGGLWSLAARNAGWSDSRPLWTGSCPCQPFSVAGMGAGVDDPRHLWPHFHRLIAGRRPEIVAGEQVAGKAGYGWLDGVRSDLESEGYACEAFDIPACAVDAPHIRQRLYWAAERVAEPDGCVGGRRSDEPERRPEGRNAHRRIGERVAQGNSDGEGRLQSERSLAEFGRRLGDAGTSDGRGVALGDPYRARRGEYGGTEPVPSQLASAECAGGFARAEGVGLAHSECIEGGERYDADMLGRRAGDAEQAGMGGRGDGVRQAHSRDDGTRSFLGQTEDRGRKGMDAGAEGIRRGDGTSLPSRAYSRNSSIRNGSFWSDHEWRIGADGKARRVKPGLRLLDSGLAGRVGGLRIGGNGIVAPLATEFLGALMDVLP